MKIVILDGYALNPGDLSWSQLNQYGIVDIYERTAPELILERCKDADIAITNKVKFSAETLQQLPQLKCIVVTATGYNIIDLQAASNQGVVVCNAPNYSSTSVAQHVFALILNITNSIASYSQSNRAGKWTSCPDFCYIDTPTVELSGKTLGIVGMGNIGRSVANIANAFGLKVIALTSKPQDQLPPYVESVSKEQLLTRSDILSLHCPLTTDTEHFINAQTLSLMKPGAILINTSRGPLVNEQAVAASLQSGRLAAFGADVLSTEPPSASNPLLTAPNSFLTPHIAWATLEARQRLMDITINNVSAFIQGTPINVVNP